jgi:predicted AAA+ superfamily ATPase
MELHSLSKNEKDGIVFGNDLDYSLDCFQARQAQVPKNDIVHIFDHIWRGGMPQVLHADSEQRQEYYNAYANTYLMRDVTELGGITDTLRFGKYLSACAALVAEQVNYKTLADTAGITQPTAKEWLRLLEGLGIVYLLRPYASNALKRLTKTPKLYFCDTGLAAHLSMWLTRETLMSGAASGHYFENYVVSELLKHYAYAPHKANLTYYRDSNAKEIDLLVEQNNMVHPLEIKKSANPDRREVKKFSVFEKAPAEWGCGGIVCMCEEVTPIDERHCFIPCNLI